jgi:uncharacterized repeat protein (TIGR03843 family)
VRRSIRPVTSAPGATATRTDHGGEATESAGAPAPNHHRLLETAELELVGRLIDATNATFLVSLDGGPAQAIYKPTRGERPLSDFPHGTLANRERSAYLLSEATGWRIVPPTVLRDGPFGPGMVQAWLEQDPTADVFEMLRQADPRLRRIAVFDVIANNADRKGGHLLPVDGGHVHGVDHGICFAVQPKLRTVLWAWRGQPLDAAELAVVEAIRAGFQGALGEALAELLSAAEVRAALLRAERLLRRGRFPHPDPDRPAVPWPPY